ncbi:MAG: phage holin family protein [Proteobacteria bacterium]|nr:phage holin family protein [Pseudomonadota bacterium]
MNGLLVRWLVLTCAILVTSYIFDGIYASGFFSAFFAAAVLGIFNAVLRPILLIITLPINILSLGLFTFVINAMLLNMAGIIPGFEVRGFWTAVFGSLTISIVSWVLNVFINERGAVGYIDLNKKGNAQWE